MDSHVLDRAVIDELRALEATTPGLVRQVVKAYLETSDRLWVSLREAARSEDPPAVATAAHGLKGASAQVGAVALASGFKEIEELARIGKSAGLERRIEALQAAFTSARAALVAEADG